MLSRRFERFEVGEGIPFLNNLVHGLVSLPVSVSARAIHGDTR